MFSFGANYTWGWGLAHMLPSTLTSVPLCPAVSIANAEGAGIMQLSRSTLPEASLSDPSILAPTTINSILLTSLAALSHSSDNQFLVPLGRS